MNESDAHKKLVELLKVDKLRMEILQVVGECDLSDAYVAAGFLRNLAWDYCHGFSDSPLNDIDVIFFDSSFSAEGSPSADGSLNLAKQKRLEKKVQQQLSLSLPHLHWDVKNQARMHIKNNHSPYLNTSDAMSWWPELETAVGVKLHNEELRFVAPFGLARLFSCSISHNPKRNVHTFNQRIKKKNWIKHWPKLKPIFSHQSLQLPSHNDRRKPLLMKVSYKES